MSDSDSDYDMYHELDFRPEYSKKRNDDNTKIPKCCQCGFSIKEPICRFRNTNWGGYPIPMFENAYMHGYKYKNKIYCITCYGYAIGNLNIVSKLEQKNKNLEDKLKQTEEEKKNALNKIKELENQIENMKFYAPDGPGYFLAKEHFEELVSIGSSDTSKN